MREKKTTKNRRNEKRGKVAKTLGTSFAYVAVWWSGRERWEGGRERERRGEGKEMSRGGIQRVLFLGFCTLC